MKGKEKAMLKKNVILKTIAILLVAFTVVSVASYSIAKLNRGDSNSSSGDIAQNEVQSLASSITGVEYLSSIDLILENAEKGETFNIVEVLPYGTGTPTDLEKYSTSGGFAQYVLYAYRETYAGTFTEAQFKSMVSYQSVSVNPETKMEDMHASGSTIQEIMDNADLIYVSSPTYTSYNGTSNMSEDVYNYLHNYVASNKPIIMDFVTSSSSSSSATSKTYFDFVNAVSRNHIKFRTFSWTDGLAADKFFTAKDNASYYLKYGVNGLSQRAPGTVLVVTASDTPGGDSMYTRMSGYANVIKEAYYGKDELKPEEMKYTIWNASTTPLTVEELNKGYDFILIENDAKALTMTDAVYKKLKALSESSKYILYDSRLISTSTGTISGTANNYLKLLQLYVSDKGVEQRKNVLAITYGYFASLVEQGAGGIAGAEPIADLLNGSEYRDSSTSGAGGRKYRVLEIQPCYPVDLDLAKTLPTRGKYAGAGFTGGYYIYPDQVLYGVTKDEIEADVEYYAFEISKAKIAHATGVPYDQIEIEAMSTNELISSKEVVLENYDFVYIGGDASALVPYMQVNYSGGDWNWQNDIVPRVTAAFTAFDMYTHTGSFVDYDSAMTYNRVGGANASNFVEFNGNDLTVTKRDQLKDYVDSGLPIIIDKLVTDAFEKSYTAGNRLKQLELHDIDPDSNMYQFLEYTYKKVTEGSVINVGWGTVDAATDETAVDNLDREYGNTLGSTVTVYDKDCETGIKALITGSAKRPSLAVTSYPKQYVEGNASTTNTDATATFTAGVNLNATDEDASSYEVTLLVDTNGDGMYSEEEEVDSATCASGATVDLSYQLDEDFFGLVNWKIRATAPNGVLCDVKSGNAFFKVTEDMKKKVRILQVMPVDKPFPSGGAAAYTHGHTLYFCTECQMAAKMIENNMTVNTNATARTNIDSCQDIETVWGTDGIPAVTVGKHEHNFGIVVYDTTTNLDNWEENFADELTHGESGTLEDGDYEFDIDILTVEEFEELCTGATERTEEQIDTATALADEFLVMYEEQYATLTAKTNLLRLNLETELYKAAASIDATGYAYRQQIVNGIGNAENPGLWIIDGDYYKFWEYFNNTISGASNYKPQNIVALANAYNSYITAYDEVVALKEQYKTNLRQAGDTKTWMANNYDIIVLGLSDEFNGKDLSDTACTQIKDYLAQGGSLLNTHDTITAKSDGAPNMSDELRAAFGMDRFHVVDFGESSTVNVAVEMNYTVPSTKNVKFGIRNQFGETWGGLSVPISNRDIEITVNTGWGGNLSYREVGDPKGVGEDIKVTFVGSLSDQGDLLYLDPNESVVPITGGAYESITISAPVSIETEISRGSFQLGESNVNATMATEEGKSGVFTASAATTEVAADGTIQLNVTVLSDGNPVPSGINVTCDYRGNQLVSQTNDNGVASFVINPAWAATTSIYDAPTGCKYRLYDTIDNSKYFWTQRIQAATEADFQTRINHYNVDGYLRYNAPVGITDLYASCHSSSRPTSPYRYASSDLESFDHEGVDVDGWQYERKYGTRKAEKVNEGGVTMYPFAISDELLISPTHSQTFSLDMEDESVAVWYTLGATVVDDGYITSEFAHYVSSYFAASPRDGMNNYFLYSKENVFYTGAGHQVITGKDKDNNDERRLFINVIVNSVTKGVTGPKLKLYNKCDEEGNSHENCDDLYVDPKDKEGNEKLSEEINTLFYNEAIEMYQYNIDESQTEIYPEFDFKAIAGTADIKEVVVFYDLNYGDGDGMDQSDTYVDDDNHVLITSYDKSDQVDGKRKRLRETVFPQTLKLEEDYFAQNKNWTYIVIRVKDEKGKWKAARVKINIIPHLFDLTDATQDSQKTWTDTPVMDVLNKKNYTI